MKRLRLGDIAGFCPSFRISSLPVGWRRCPHLYLPEKNPRNFSPLSPSFLPILPWGFIFYSFWVSFQFFSEHLKNVSGLVLVLGSWASASLRNCKNGSRCLLHPASGFALAKRWTALIQKDSAILHHGYFGIEVIFNRFSKFLWAVIRPEVSKVEYIYPRSMGRKY